ncbi:MAG: asparagine synthase-related protein [Rhizobiaceae bacterium]
MLQRIAQAFERGEIPSLLRQLDGQFALVAKLNTTTIAAVDRLRSIPLAFARNESGNWFIDPIGGRLAERLNLTKINRGGALALAMAGYTVGSDTLFEDLHTLVAGEVAVFAPDPEVLRYDTYESVVAERDETELKQQLSGITLRILEKLIDRADGNTIVVPLSAGLDSRLIVSGLRHLGYENVKCFSYGLAGNHEAQAAKAIAAELKYDWRFIPFSVGTMRRFFQSEVHEDYLKYADTATSSPFEQDLFAINQLKQDSYIPEGSIVANGNSGDFISGGHIPTFMGADRACKKNDGDDLEPLMALTEKHFRLWTALGTAKNDDFILALLRSQCANLGLSPVTHDPYEIFEIVEFLNRQSKYVVSGQRVYEFAGLDWSLPLWDVEYLDFWRSCPRSAKLGQNLYRKMLIEENWAGVWGDDWWWPQSITPAWIKFPRLFLKACHVPLGVARWHRFERRFLLYWMETMASQAIVPYMRVAKDKRGARHSVAWHCEAYLRKKGVDLEDFL